MDKLLPLYRILPPLLVVFGIVMTAASAIELRTSAGLGGGMDATYLHELRVTYLAGLVKSFDSMFFYFALAAVVAAANRYLEKETR